MPRFSSALSPLLIAKSSTSHGQKTGHSRDNCQNSRYNSWLDEQERGSLLNSMRQILAAAQLV
jgi:hypothetical protein